MNPRLRSLRSWVGAGGTIESWVHKFNAQGLDGIEPNWKGNPGTILSEEELEQLRKAIKKPPRDVGFKNGRWTGCLVAAFVYERFGKRISIRTAIRYLHRLGFKLKRARKKFKKADPEKQKRFAKDLQELEKSRSPRSVTVYVDEVRYGVMPHSGVFGLRLVLR